MKQPEYTEGPEAFANFERFAKQILQAPKPKRKTKKRPKKAAPKSKPKSDRD
jgi:hypothetical protein